MSDEVWIFVSYAHNDDLQLGDSKDEKGFVTFLHEMLEKKLSDLGATRARIWRDRKRISDGDQFDGKIDDGLKRAQILVVVMSNNWLARPYCRQELDSFIELQRANGISNVAERTIVVGKGHVDRGTTKMTSRTSRRSSSADRSWTQGFSTDATILPAFCSSASTVSPRGRAIVRQDRRRS